MRKGSIISAVCVLLILFCPAFTLAAGFALYENGAAPLAMGGAFTAQADTPAALFYNPAGITQLEGKHISGGVTMIVPNFEFESATTGHTTEPENDPEFPATFYYTQQMNDRFWLGFGFFSPFGLATEWPEDWEGRYISVKSDLLTFTLNPNVAFKVTDWLSLAMGAEVLYLDAELTKMIPTNVNTIPSEDVLQKLEGDGFGFGANAAAHLNFGNLRFGLSYRSPIDVEIDDGDISFEHSAASRALPVTTLPTMPPTVVDRNGPRNFKDGSGSTTVKLPQSVAGGVAYTFLERLTFEFDFQWTEWSSYDDLEIILNEPLFQAASPPGASVSRNPKNWNDVWAYRFGVQYKATRDLTLRAGYVYDESPIPDSTFDSMLPGNDRQIYSFGAGYKIKRFNIDLAYVYWDMKSRTKTATSSAAGRNLTTIDPLDVTKGGGGTSFGGTTLDRPAAGDYDADAHFVALQVSYSF
ncbi:MAG: OmpP1/FadL family transporter [Syntrophobacteria bacterium]